MGRYETPYYSVVLSEDSFEIREYSEFDVVEYDNDSDPYISRGFGTLFSYISDNNKQNQKISMTVPVIEEIKLDKMKMAFVVSKKLKDNIPEPNDDNLKIRKFDSGVFAVVKYSGFSNRDKESKMIQRLEEWYTGKGYSRISNYMLAFFNPPFTPPMFRRNEIMVRVEKQ